MDHSPSAIRGLGAVNALGESIALDAPAVFCAGAASRRMNLVDFGRPETGVRHSPDRRSASQKGDSKERRICNGEGF
jgi:hypothetical protein